MIHEKRVGSRQAAVGSISCRTPHPAYMGSIIQALGFPLLFGSLWSILPVALLILLFIVRTSLEDKTLMEELRGYSDYSNKTRYRIIPFVW